MFVSFLLCYTLSTYSQEPSLEKIVKKIEQLEKRISILEDIIANKDKKNQNIITNDKQRWRNLKKGMNQQEVRDLLGEPLKINTGNLTYWYYSGEQYHSYVIFDYKDKVYGWDEPE